MYLEVTESLALQLTETEAFLKAYQAADTSTGRNDAHLFRPTLEALDKLTVAVLTARVPTTSFLASSTAETSTKAWFDFTEGGLAKNLDRSITYLRNPDLLAVQPTDLSIFSLNVAKEPLGLLKSIYFGVTVAVRKAAERDLVDLHGKSVGTFLASAEVIRGWAVAED